MKPIPEIKPSKPGTVLYYINEKKVEDMKTYFERFKSKARFIGQVCEEGGMKPNPETLMGYAMDPNALMDDFVARQVEDSGNPKGMLLEILKRETKEQIRAQLLPIKDEVIVKDLFPYIAWSKEAKNYVLDTDKLVEDNSVYMDEEMTEVWDRHRLIAHLLSDFMGKITDPHEILEYFDVSEDGSIVPTTGRFLSYYPPTNGKE